MTDHLFIGGYGTSSAKTDEIAAVMRNQGWDVGGVSYSETREKNFWRHHTPECGFLTDSAGLIPALESGVGGEIISFGGPTESSLLSLAVGALHIASDTIRERQRRITTDTLLGGVATVVCHPMAHAEIIRRVISADWTIERSLGIEKKGIALTQVVYERDHFFNPDGSFNRYKAGIMPLDDDDDGAHRVVFLPNGHLSLLERPEETFLAYLEATGDTPTEHKAA